MIKKIKLIQNLAVFKDFDWDTQVRNKNNGVETFKHINIIYGRNYSGKTTLSRILRAMETDKLSDKFENPSFCVSFANGREITQDTLIDHDKTIRVFNEDFVRDNLSFINNPDDNIEAFAILGEENIIIQKQIEALEKRLGSEEGEKTGLYAKQAEKLTAHENAENAYKEAQDALEKQLKIKATDKDIGIKYNSNRFGDQNYNISKLRNDIEKVTSESYQSPSNEQVQLWNGQVLEKKLQPLSIFRVPELNFTSLAIEVKKLVNRKISEYNKIEELVTNAILNRWVKEGHKHHKDKRNKCAFCGNSISENRWQELEKHFDEESELLEKDIDILIKKITQEKRAVQSTPDINKDLFYSQFYNRLDELKKDDAVEKYIQFMDLLIDQLEDKKEDILNQKSFIELNNTTSKLENFWRSYLNIQTESNKATASLDTEQKNVRKQLRLKEVWDFCNTIEYSKRLSKIKILKEKRDKTNNEKNSVDNEIYKMKEDIKIKRSKLNDEEKGANKVNEYLNNFFGHQFLSIRAKRKDNLEEDSKQICFEVIRDDNKAYHLSEGECSLLAFCYFLAKLDDIDTQNSKPIIWIDDPISSLDSNHIFFIYSLIHTEIVSAGKFEQLFISTHNLDFLKYLRRLNGKYFDPATNKNKNYQKSYFFVIRQGERSTIQVMPKYLKEYATEFNYLFHQMQKCTEINIVNDENYMNFCNFPNNARKFLEIYLYYKYPNQRELDWKLKKFFGGEIPAILTDRINNEYSHMCGALERGSMPVEVPEMQEVAKQIIQKLKNKDADQYNALLESIGKLHESQMQA